MEVLFGHFNNHDKSSSIMRTDGKRTMVINKPLKAIAVTESINSEVFDYASDEIGSYFMSMCNRRN